MFHFNKEGVSSLFFVGFILMSLTGCGGSSGGDGQNANNPPENSKPVVGSPGVGVGEDNSDRPDMPRNFETLYENNPKIQARFLQVTSEQTSENIPEQERIEVYRTQDSTGEELSFKFEWIISSTAALFGNDALVFRKGDSEVRIATIFANPGTSMLTHRAECKIQMDWSATCAVSGKPDSIGNTVNSDLATILGNSPGEVVVESELCNVLGSCNRYRLGTIYVH